MADFDLVEYARLRILYLPTANYTAVGGSKPLASAGFARINAGRTRMIKAAPDDGTTLYISMVGPQSVSVRVLLVALAARDIALGAGRPTVAIAARFGPIAAPWAARDVHARTEARIPPSP